MVTVVVAVRGRSAEAEEIASCEEGGSLPVNSNLRIRDFRSSNSSHTVEGAVVDNVDSVPSCRVRSDSIRARSVASEVEVCLLLRIVDSAELRKARESWNDARLSPFDSGYWGELSMPMLLSRLRGRPMAVLELAT